MTAYIATFHTHLSALLTCRALTAAGVAAQMMPVPRRLSAACGTCVRYTADSPMLSCMDTDYEAVYETADNAAPRLLCDRREVRAGAYHQILDYRHCLLLSAAYARVERAHRGI